MAKFRVDAIYDSIDERVREEAKYVLETGSTVRKTAQVFNISKSTVYSDISQRLKNLDLVLWKKVKKVVEHNKRVRHLRGGYATKLRNEKLKSMKKGDI